jgi:cobalamin biosynthesis Mg chelatase CobN
MPKVYPRHVHARINGEYTSKVIYGPDEELPEVWKESPADLKPVTEQPGELAAAMEEALDAHTEDNAFVTDVPLASTEAPATVEDADTEETPSTATGGATLEAEPAVTVTEVIGGTPASRKAAKKARKEAAMLKAQAAKEARIPLTPGGGGFDDIGATEKPETEV